MKEYPGREPQAQPEQQQNTYYLDQKPRVFRFKVFLAALLIFAICGAGCYAATQYRIDHMTSSAASAERSLLKENADKDRSVKIGPSLRESTVNEVVEAQSIPAYSYDDCWNLDVSQPSGVTLADLKLVSRGAFVGIEDAFLKAEQDYGVNCLFVMGIASLESANGTMCFRPNNMFGFGSRGFSSKSECVDVVSRALANNYLNPGGSLYNGKRITDVNKRYAASSTWDEKVCRNMARYYSIIAPSHNAQLEKLK